MRLPADAALIVIDAQRAIDDLWGTARPLAAAIGAAVAGVALGRTCRSSTSRRTSTPADGRAYLPEAPPRPGEAMLAMTGARRLRRRRARGLARRGWRDTLVFCGFGDPGPVETSLRGRRFARLPAVRSGGRLRGPIARNAAGSCPRRHPANCLAGRRARPVPAPMEGERRLRRKAFL